MRNDGCLSFNVGRQPLTASQGASDQCQPPTKAIVQVLKTEVSEKCQLHRTAHLVTVDTSRQDTTVNVLAS